MENNAIYAEFKETLEKAEKLVGKLLSTTDLNSDEEVDTAISVLHDMNMDLDLDLFRFEIHTELMELYPGGLPGAIVKDKLK